MICDASIPTYLLTHWARDRSRGAGIDLAQAVHLQTQRTAELYGLGDRGVVEAGKKAAQAMRAFVDNIEKTGVEQLKSEGMEVVVTVDRKSFEDAVAPAYEEYYKRFDKKLIEDIRNTR